MDEARERRAAELGRKGYVLSDRIGAWANSATGRIYWPSDPRPEDVCLEDIALSLAKLNRFGGHLRRDVESYTVAQHSVLVSYECEPRFALIGLLHDAHEAYLGDPIRPIHRLLEGNYWRAVGQWQVAIALYFGLSMNALKHVITSVKDADNRVLVTERRDVCQQSAREHDLPYTPLETRIVPLRAFDAYDLFMARFSELTERVAT